MTYRSLFIDLDDTLCDTSTGDKKAVADYDQILLNKWDVATNHNIAAKLIHAIYQPPVDDQYKTLRNSNPAEHRSMLLFNIFKEAELDHISQSECSELNDVFMELRMKYFDFFDGALDLLKLYKKKYKCVLITNGPTYSQRLKIARCNVESHVDHILVGGEQPHSKPHASIFKRACELVGCATNEVIHMGDSLFSDIGGANGVGMDCIWINAENKEIPAEYHVKWKVSSFVETSSFLL